MKMQVERQAFYEPGEILRAVKDKIEKVRAAGEPIDYLAFVPDGEPTLDVNLGQEIGQLKRLGFPIAVITNSSLIWRQDVREDLMGADWVSLKFDAVEDELWRRIDRPYGRLRLPSIQEGALGFARVYGGNLVTETMLVAGVNDAEGDLRKIADFLARLRPAAAYLAIPTRPPAEEWIQLPSEEVVNRAYQILNERVEQVEYLIGYEGNDFALTGDVEQDLLSITAVHPMREEAVSKFLAQAKVDWPVVHKLVEQDQLIEMEYEGRRFYMRRLHRNDGHRTDEAQGDAG
jgi:wyosine [tRNA(Phe)-imidazoG37] synthetase (radical SAM superfamily)